MNSNVAGLSQAYHMLFVAALIFLAVMAAVGCALLLPLLRRY